MKSINELFWNEDQSIFNNDNQLNSMGDCIIADCQGDNKWTPPEEPIPEPPMPIHW